MRKLLMCITAFALCTTYASDKQKIMEAHGKMSEEMKKDPKRYERECGQGNAHSCTREGVMTAFGTWGHKKDYVRARGFLEKACNGGDQEGCKELAVLHQYGRGVAKDEGKALALYTKACEARNSTACYFAAELHQYGRGTKKDLPKAREYLSKACAAGYRSACTKKI